MSFLSSGRTDPGSRRLPARAPSVEAIPPAVSAVVASAGRSLDSSTRTFMEPRFGHDFSRVRVHSGGAAQSSARAVDAQAYSVGHHIVLGGGGAASQGLARQTLLAHELAHVVQHGTVAPSAGFISSPHDSEEQNAAQAARRVVAGGRDSFGALRAAGAAGTRGAVLHRQVTVPPVTAATFDDTLRFIVNETGFAQGAVTPPNPATHTGADSSRFGTAAHNQQLRAAVSRATQLGYPEANRLVEGVRVDSSTGRVIGINVPPGQKGTLNFDLVRVRSGQTLVVGDVLQNKVDMTFDAKFGGISTNRNQAAFARRNGIAHLDLQAGNFRIKTSGPTGGTAPPVPPVGAAPSPHPGPKPVTTPAPVAPKPVTTPAPVAPKPAPAVKASTPTLSAPKPATTGVPAKPAPITVPKGAGGRPPGVMRSQGGQLAGQAALALVAMVLQIVVQRYIQGELDKMNAVAFEEKLKAQQPRIEQMIAAQLPVAERLKTEGKAAFANITLYVHYQTDVSGELGGGTAFMGLEVRKVEISATKLPYVTTSNVQTGFFEYAFKQQLGMSESLLSFSVSFPDMQVVSEADPSALPPPKCFIATACYGSPFAPEVQVLREFRDVWLARYLAGRTFIRIYYTLSPPAAGWLTRHAAARRVVRQRLVGPVVDAVNERRSLWQGPRTGQNPVEEVQTKWGGKVMTQLADRVDRSTSATLQQRFEGARTSSRRDVGIIGAGGEPLPRAVEMKIRATQRPPHRRGDE